MPETDAYRLISACCESLEAAEALLAQEPTLIHSETGIGETPLHYLAVEDKLEAVRWLAARGAAIDARNSFGDTPLSDAASLVMAPAELNRPAAARQSRDWLDGRARG